VISGEKRGSTREADPSAALGMEINSWRRCSESDV
jgi:hypothetical protein